MNLSQLLDRRAALQKYLSDPDVSFTLREATEREIIGLDKLIAQSGQTGIARLTLAQAKPPASAAARRVRERRPVQLDPVKERIKLLTRRRKMLDKFVNRGNGSDPALASAKRESASITRILEQLEGTQRYEHLTARYCHGKAWEDWVTDRVGANWKMVIHATKYTKEHYNCVPPWRYRQLEVAYVRWIHSDRYKKLIRKNGLKPITEK